MTEFLLDLVARGDRLLLAALDTETDELRIEPVAESAPGAVAAALETMLEKLGADPWPTLIITSFDRRFNDIGERFLCHQRVLHTPREQSRIERAVRCWLEADRWATCPIVDDEPARGSPSPVDAIAILLVIALPFLIWGAAVRWVIG